MTSEIQLSSDPPPDAQPEPEPAPRSRRNVLVAALGGVAGLIAGRISAPGAAQAAAGQPLIIGSEANNAGTSNTQLIANSNVVTFKLYQQGPGTALMGYATPGSGGTRGVYGRVDSPSGDGVQARNAGAAGTGAAVRAYGGNNAGVVATTDGATGAAVKAVHTKVSTSRANEPAIVALASSGLATDPHPNGRYFRASLEAAGPNGIIGAGSSDSGDGYGVIGIAKGTTGNGVHGNALGASGRGVSAEAGSSTGTTYGVHATAASTSGTGVYGQASAASGATYGVRALASSPSGYGVYATNGATTGNATAGYFSTSSAGGWALQATSKYVGIAGYATNASGQCWGVYGNAPATGWAVYAAGNALVTGTLSKGGGAFKIDHPLDPENKYLLHSFVESPDMKNVYDGVVELDAKGEATVELPAWFEALNKDFRYQLTAMGSSAPDLYVKSGVKDNAFTIAGGKPGQEVSWLLTGIRQDAWAEANRIPVEEKKRGDEKGRYLHPKEHGKSADRGIDLKPHGKPAPEPSVQKATPNQGNQ